MRKKVLSLAPSVPPASFVWWAPVPELKETLSTCSAFTFCSHDELHCIWSVPRRLTADIYRPRVMSWTHNLNMVRWVKRHFSASWLFRDVAITSIITQPSSIKHQVKSQDGFGQVERLLRDAHGRKITCCINQVVLWSTKGDVEGQSFQASGGSQNWPSKSV